jgi:ABC-2 type transport system permease protein
VADVVQVPGVLEQIRLVAGVRWRILRNGLRQKHNRWDLIAMIWVGIVSAAITFGGCFGFFAGGYELLATNRASWLALLFWIIFLWWQVLPVFIAGFGSNFEFSRLLRFPLSMRAFYLLGLGYGLSDFAAISSICWVLSMLAGAATARLSVVPVMLPACVLFVLWNLTLERLIGSWLEKILTKRKTRELFVGLFVLAMVSMNLLNPVLHRIGRAERFRFLHYIPYLRWLPASLAGNAIRDTIVADFRGVTIAIVSLFAWALLTSALLWRRYAAQYAGEEISDSPAPAAARKREKKQAVAGELPGLLASRVAAVVVKEFRYLMRNGFAFMALIIPPIMAVFFTLQFGPGSVLKEHSLKPGMFYPGMIAYMVLILLSPAYNALAYEGKGIQTYFMAPVRFQDVLLGKNLFLVCLVAFELALTLTILIVRVGWPGTPLFAATVSAAAFAVSGQLAIANWSSLNFPRKMEIGKMKGQRNSGVAVWTAFGVQIVLIGVGTMILLVSKWTDSPWLPAIAFTALTAAAVGGYVSSLEPLSRLADTKKELLIEALCK